MRASSLPKARLCIDAADESTEIFLMDASLRRIASAVGRYVGEVAQGLYKVRFRAGGGQRDELVELGPEGAVVQGAPVAFAATVPLAGTLGYRADQAEAARQALRAPPRRLGEGGELLLFVREAEAGRVPAVPPLALYSLRGERLARFAERDLVPDAGCAALRLTLDPGTYALRAESGEPLEMFVGVCAKWQTRAWLLMDECWQGGQCLHRPGLGSAVLSMARPGDGFDAADPRERLAELACQALRQGRDVVSEGLWQAVLDDAFECPMLGLYVAHMLLARRPPEMERVRAVLDRSRWVIGDHADFIALEMALAGRRSKRARPRLPDHPPSLARGWRLLMRAARRGRDLIDSHSLLCHIGEDVMQGEPWLIHRAACHSPGCL